MAQEGSRGPRQRINRLSISLTDTSSCQIFFQDPMQVSYPPDPDDSLSPVLFCSCIIHPFVTPPSILCCYLFFLQTTNKLCLPQHHILFTKHFLTYLFLFYIKLPLFCVKKGYLFPGNSQYVSFCLSCTSISNFF